jgi:hypothetical protein
MEKPVAGVGDLTWAGIFVPLSFLAIWALGLAWAQPESNGSRSHLESPTLEA